MLLCGRPRSLADYVASGGKVPIRWTAVEALTKKKYSEKSDVWSFGIVCHEVMTNGSKPYGKWPNSVVIEQVVNGYILPCPAKCPEDLYDACVAPCFIYETKQRPTFMTLVERFAVVLGEQNQSELKAKRKAKAAVVTEDEDETTFKATTLQRDEVKLEILQLLDQERTSLEWNHGEIDDAEAERRLRLCAPPGVPAGEQVSVHERELFLLREVSTLTLVVSILREGNFGHHAIDYDKFARVWIEQRPPEGSQPPLAKGIVESVRKVFKRWKLDDGALQPLPRQDVPKESDYNTAEVSVEQLDLAKYMALDEGAVESEEDRPEAEAEAAPEEAMKKKRTRKEKKEARKEAKKRELLQDGEADVDIDAEEDMPTEIAETNVDDVVEDNPDVGQDVGNGVESVAEAEPDPGTPTALAPLVDFYDENAVLYTTVVPKAADAEVAGATAESHSKLHTKGAPAAEARRTVYTTMVFGDGGLAEPAAVDGCKSPFARELSSTEMTAEDPFAATAIPPTAAPQPSTSSPPPQPAPRRPANPISPPTYRAGAGGKPAIAKKPAPVSRLKNSRAINALNPFGEEDSEEEDSNDDDQPAPAPKVRITAMKKKNATKPVKTPRKFGTKKNRRMSGGAALMFDSGNGGETEI